MKANRFRALQVRCQVGWRFSKRHIKRNGSVWKIFHGEEIERKMSLQPEVEDIPSNQGEPNEDQATSWVITTLKHAKRLRLVQPE